MGQVTYELAGRITIQHQPQLAGSDLKTQVDDQLPEMGWGFHCDFNNDLWSCALPPEAESLLDRSFSLEDMIRASVRN